MSETQLHETIARLNKVSPSFCLAKWLQTTLHLHMGETHSCHHPGTHPIPLEEIAVDPSALHNTNHKKSLRRQMLEGQRPQECDFCWKIEDSDASNISDRHFKSNDSWALPHLEQIKNAPWDQSTTPSYVEVSFSRACNFKCAYCEPRISSSWMKEYDKEGPYTLVVGADKIYPEGEIERLKKNDVEADNAYVQAFWKWWPELSEKLEVFRITGGEPLMSPSTFRVLEDLKAKPRKHLQMNINSNLGVSEGRIRQLADAINEINAKKHVKEFGLFTSLDTWGAQAEYIRDGLDLDLFRKNFRYLLDHVQPLKITFMVTFNILSFARFNEFLQFVIDERRRQRELGHLENYIFVDISYLRYPAYLAPHLANDELIKMGEDILAFMQANRQENDPDGFHFFEIEKMHRMMSWIKSAHPPINLSVNRANFSAFITEYDRRRGREFSAVFPEYARFKRLCEAEARVVTDQVASLPDGKL